MVEKNKSKYFLNIIAGKDKGKSLPIDKHRFIVGRRVGDLILSDTKISAAHFALEKHHLGYILIDLDSTNGTKLNGKKAKVAVLQSDDEIVVGTTKLKFSKDLSFSDTSSANDKTEKEIKLKDHENYPALSEKELKETGAKIKSSIAHDYPVGEENTYSGATPKARLSIRVLAGPEEGAVFYLNEEKSVIGRISADINLADKLISRKHAVVEINEELEVSLKDLSTKSGTYVNNRRVLSCKLKDGDKIQVGKTILELVLED